MYRLPNLINIKYLGHPRPTTTENQKYNLTGKNRNNIKIIA